MLFSYIEVGNQVDFPANDFVEMLKFGYRVKKLGQVRMVDQHLIFPACLDLLHQLKFFCRMAGVAFKEIS